ncbi:cryptochrome/photolyase family protein [Microbacterium xanthum]|uniref:cryptochrome/photolyase family protein n=1 Tax=Microbacterium xanthum TaxID=3079794 RepID=UPI002AD2F072|nr:cryptochrome/photolyase family protein [Microbacterium sp. KSW-48]MDZ8172576.1 cryptochrome/photolyase family protein [Microbacterium sp. KSW-48]
MKAALILGTQLFEEHPAYADEEIDVFFFVEARSSFARRRYHAHKRVLLLAGLRHAAAAAEQRGRAVARVPLHEGLGFAQALRRMIREYDVDGLAWMSATDRAVDRRISAVCDEAGISTRRYDDALFLTPTADLDAWFAEHPAARMEDFYRWQRRRTGILMDGAAPAGRRWNFDADNREPLPRDGIEVPALPDVDIDELTASAIEDVASHFPDAPGDPREFWLPVTPAHARAWLDTFVDERLASFGQYEDAMAADEPFLFHSVVSPLLNVGLLAPAEVVSAVVARRDDVPLAAVEGFTRQVIGWREYMRGAYRAWPDLMTANHFRLGRDLEEWWYTGVDVPEEIPLPVRTVLARVMRYGYAHHIERLMVLGNWFLLQGYDPRAVYEWFSALFVDAYEWVMVPNVQGMSQYADGGRVATKPYISGGAYLQRMGSWWPTERAARESAFTAAYWRFLDEHEDLLAGNPRLNMPLAQMRRRRESA